MLCPRLHLPDALRRDGVACVPPQHRHEQEPHAAAVPAAVQPWTARGRRRPGPGAGARTEGEGRGHGRGRGESLGGGGRWRWVGPARRSQGRARTRWFWNWVQARGELVAGGDARQLLWDQHRGSPGSRPWEPEEITGGLSRLQGGGGGGVLPWGPGRSSAPVGNSAKGNLDPLPQGPAAGVTEEAPLGEPPMAFHSHQGGQSLPLRIQDQGV